MTHINIEIKAITNNLDGIREKLNINNAEFKGADHQTDTYFNVRNGRLKFRGGNIENYLIYYDREDKMGPKQSGVTLYKYSSKSNLKDILTRSLGILVVVEKQREIYFIENVKFHLDTVAGLGTLVEIEATDHNGSFTKDTLLRQCNQYLDLFGIHQEDLIPDSYSDLLLLK